MFAELSGDYNPIHIDEHYARRTVFGIPIVHGVNALLWGLDCYLNEMTETLSIRSIKTIFKKAVLIGEAVEIFVSNNNDKHTTIKLKCNGLVAVLMEIRWIPGAAPESSLFQEGNPEKQQPKLLLEDEMPGSSGTLGLFLNSGLCRKIFPNIYRCIPQPQIAIILATTRLVGMHCPGLNSLYSEVNLNWGASEDHQGLKYCVSKFDNRAGLVIIELISSSMSGEIKAIVRPTACEQDSCKTLKSLVCSNEFSAHRALVIGGSRGLGEVTSKLIAMGGGEVMLTYNRGKDDAYRVTHDVRACGGTIDNLEYNVLIDNDKYTQKLMHEWGATHLYYFATPSIVGGTNGYFSEILFQEFCKYYVSGFAKTINLLDKAKLQKIFYPSTVYLDDIPLNMSEYVAAKAAGEKYCDYLLASNKDIEIYKPKLPRVSTDQTVSNFPIKNESTTETMIEHLTIFINI